MYQHFGCELYNTVMTDNGVTRYSLCYSNDSSVYADQRLIRVLWIRGILMP